MQSTVATTGKIKARKIHAPRAPLSWKLKNFLRFDFILGLLGNTAAKALSAITGIPTITSTLRAVHVSADGQRLNYGIISRRLVTTVFVNNLVDNMVAETSAWGDYKFHDSGVGTTGANITDTDIETTDNESRATGTQLEGASANIYKSVGTITYSGTLAITEHGLMNIVTAGILLDRHTFTAINVENTDSIEFTYELTVSSGG